MNINHTRIAPIVFCGGMGAIFPGQILSSMRNNYNYKNIKNMLSNALTCYWMRKDIIQRKTCYPMRKRCNKTQQTCYPSRQTCYAARKTIDTERFIQCKTCYLTRKRVMPTWKHNIQHEKRVIQCGNMLSSHQCKNVLSNVKTC